MPALASVNSSAAQRSSGGLLAGSYLGLLATRLNTPSRALPALIPASHCLAGPRGHPRRTSQVGDRLHARHTCPPHQSLLGTRLFALCMAAAGHSGARRCPSLLPPASGRRCAALPSPPSYSAAPLPCSPAPHLALSCPPHPLDRHGTTPRLSPCLLLPSHGPPQASAVLAPARHPASLTHPPPPSHARCHPLDRHGMALCLSPCPPPGLSWPPAGVDRHGMTAFHSPTLLRLPMLPPCLRQAWHGTLPLAMPCHALPCPPQASVVIARHPA